MAKLKGGSRVYGDLTVDSALVVSSDTTITGNLIVNGTTTTVNSDVSYIKDPLIEIGGGANGAALTNNDGKSRGSLLHYYDGKAVDAFMGWDTTHSEFAFGSNVAVTGDIVTFNTYGNLHANHFIGEGDLLANINGANVTGTVASANMSSYAGLVVGNAQPNITSVGTLTSVSITGTATAGNLSTAGTLTSGAANITGDSSVTGNLSVTGTISGTINATIGAKGSDTNIQFNDGGVINGSSGLTFVKSTNTLSTGNVTASGTVLAATVGNAATSLNGDGSAITNIDGAQVSEVALATHVTAADQGNITSVGTLTGLTVSGNIVAQANVTVTSNVVATGGVTGGSLTTAGTTSTKDFTITGNITGSLLPASNVTQDLGSSSQAWRDLYLSGSTIKLGSQTISANSTSITLSNNISTTTLDVSGNITAGNVSGGNLVSASFLQGTLTTAAQPNITSLGNLTSLSVTGALAAGSVATDTIYKADGTTPWDFQTAEGNAGDIQFRSAIGNDLAASTSLNFNASTNTLAVAGTVDATTLTAGNATVTGNVSGGNFNTAGAVVATGNVSGGNFTTAGSVTATGDVSGANVSATGTVSATNVSATTATVTTVNTGTVTATGDLSITSGGNISVTATKVDLNGATLTGLAAPSGATDAVTKGYVDANSQGLDVKASVRVATTASIALDGTATSVDGVTVATGDRVLVKNQSTASQNGIYVVSASGSWTRADDANATGEITGGTFTFVEEGTQADTGWVVSTNGAITIGTTSITWTQFSGAGQYAGGAGLTLSGTEFSVNVDESTLTIIDDTLQVKDGLTLVTPNIGAATGSSLTLASDLLVSGNANIVGNLAVGGTVISDTGIYSPSFTGNLIGDVMGNISGNIKVIGGNGAIQFATNFDSILGYGDLTADPEFTYDQGVLTISAMGGGVVADNLTGSLTTAAQPNITSVGNLTSLAVGGAVTAGSFKSDVYQYANGAPIDFQTAAGNATEVQFKATGSNDLAASSSFTYDTTTATLAAPNVSATNVTVSSISSTQVVVAGTDGKLTGSSALTFTAGNALVTGNVIATATVGAANVKVSSLTSGRVTFAGTDGVLTDSSTMTYAANTLSIGNVSATGDVSASTATISGAVTANSVTATGAVSGATLTGSLTTASQGNITTVGTLTGLTVAGTTSLGAVGNVNITGGTAGQYLRSTGSGGLEYATVDASMIADGTSSVEVDGTNGNVLVTVAGTQIVQVTGTGANVTGTVEVSGDVNANNITAASSITVVDGADSTSSVTGAVTVTGGIAATGNIYTGHSVGFANNNGGTASAAFIQFNATANSLDFIFN